MYIKAKKKATFKCYVELGSWARTRPTRPNAHPYLGFSNVSFKYTPRLLFNEFSCLLLQHLAYAL